MTPDPFRMRGLYAVEFTLNPDKNYQSKTAEPPKPGVQPFTMS